MNNILKQICKLINVSQALVVSNKHTECPINYINHTVTHLSISRQALINTYTPILKVLLAACHATCKTCGGTGATDCDSCDSNEYHDSTAGTCAGNIIV